MGFGMINLFVGGKEMREAYFAYRAAEKLKNPDKVIQLTTFCNAWNFAKATEQQRREHFDNG